MRRWRMRKAAMRRISWWCPLTTSTPNSYTKKVHSLVRQNMDQDSRIKEDHASLLSSGSPSSTPSHWLINYKDTKAKCRHLKKLTSKRDFVAGVTQSLQTRDTVRHVGISCPALWTAASLTFSLVQFSSLPPPSLCLSKVYTDSVWLGGGVGC